MALQRLRAVALGPRRRLRARRLRAARSPRGMQRASASIASKHDPPPHRPIVMSHRAALSRQELKRERLATAALASKPVGGPRRPNAARALCEESCDSDERAKPARAPRAPYFSSGPCAKPPGWAPEKLAIGSLGRSHRSKLGKARLGHAIELTRHVLRVPAGHRIGIVPASDTGAVEMALWNLLGARPVTLLAWESFGEGWVTDVVKQLKLDAKVIARRLWRAARSRRGRSRQRRRLHLERHHLGRARARRRLDRRRTAPASPSATRPRRRSRSTCPGTSSMSSPSPGRRCWAARARTAC